MKAPENQKPPKIFISYSWTSVVHENQVLTLAKRLCQDGIDVVLDKWDLKPGYDQFAFMEQMVTSDEIDKVLMLFDKRYVEKANAREGGVGVETQIISSELFGKVKQDKFVPIVMECENGMPCLPTYAKNQLYIDLSGTNNYAENYDYLIRLIWNQPLFRKPVLGEPPKNIFSPNRQYFSTANVLVKLESAVESNNTKRAVGHIRDFTTTLLEELEGFRISKAKQSDQNTPFDERVFQNIQDLLPLRNDYIAFLEISSQNLDSELLDPLVNLFEKLHALLDLNPQKGVNSAFSHDFDNYKFFVREILLYTVAIFLRQERYSLLRDFLNTHFFFYDWQRGQLFPKKYSAFDRPIRSLDETRNNRLNLNWLSLVGQLTIERTTKKYSKIDIAGADVLLAFAGKIAYDTFWFPRCHPYLEGHFPFLEKLRSKRHFEKVKVIFDVSTSEELKQKIQTIHPETFNYGRALFHAPLTFESFVPLDEICAYV
jgi:hypothetical protein